MNKRIDFTNLGGFPLDQDVMAFLQSSYRDAFAGLAKTFGSKTILTGVEISGGNVSAGWIAYDGELIPFIGGTLGTHVVITEGAASRVFEDSTTHDVLFTKTATCGATGDFLFSELHQPSLIPKGVITMWSGAIADIPAGWGLCDGADGRPNLTGRFIVGYDAGQTEFNAMGKTGGAKTVALTEAQLPVHHAEFNDRGEINDGVYTPGEWFYANPGKGALQGVAKSKPIGSGQAHNNLPPYYTLAYIIKL